MNMPQWFRQWLENDYQHLICKVKQINRLQWVMIGVSISVLGVALAILTEYVFKQ